MSVNKQGRAAGFVYLLVVLTGSFTLGYAPSRLIVGDGAATLEAISRHPGLFQASILAGLAMSASFLALPFALSRFLSVHGKGAARLMIVFVAASLPFSLLALLQHWEILRLVSDGAASAESVSARLAAHDRWLDAAAIFWGVWLAPLGLLVLKSGAIPRILGLLLILGCAGYLANYFGPRFVEGYEDWPWRRWISAPGSIAEIGTCLWLLLMGARR